MVEHSSKITAIEEKATTGTRSGTLQSSGVWLHAKRKMHVRKVGHVKQQALATCEGRST